MEGIGQAAVKLADAAIAWIGPMAGLAFFVILAAAGVFVAILRKMPRNRRRE